MVLTKGSTIILGKDRQRILISTEGRSFDKVYKISGTHLVEKHLKEGIRIKRMVKTLKLAQERLGGLAAKTYIYNHRFIQEYVHPLIRLKENAGYLSCVSEEEGKRRIDEYFELILKIWKRGVFDIDAGMHNFGVNLAGDIVCFDFDIMQEEAPGTLSMSNLELSAFLKVLKDNKLRLPSSLLRYYESKYKIFENIAYTEFGGVFEDYKYWRKDIEEGIPIKHLGFPHPYPMQALEKYRESMKSKEAGGGSETVRPASAAGDSRVIKDYLVDL